MHSVRLPKLSWLLLPALLLASGCLKLEKSYPQKSSYALQALRSAPSQQTPSQQILQIRKFASAPAYRGRGFVYRTGEQTWQSDYYRQFFTPPAAMITEQCRRWLQQTGIYSQINQGGYPPADHLLQGRIVALHGDYRPDRTPEAVLELQLTLIDERSTPGRIVLDRLYRRSLPLADRQPATLVNAWNEALATILSEFEAQLRQAQNPLTKQQGPAS
jgi:cholesterol transport system auxiliary component